MDSLVVDERPKHKARYLLAAFAGWPDAAQISTNAIKFLGRLTGAREFAKIDPEQFYVMTEVRPYTSVNELGQRELSWPENSFSFSDRDPQLVLFAGTEPNLAWRSYTELLLAEADRFSVDAVVTLGSLMDAVPHSRETCITGLANTKAYLERLKSMKLLESGYEGSAGIHTALMDACTKQGVPYVSLWAHSPHYVTISPNPKATHRLLVALRDVLDPTMLLDDELTDLNQAAVIWETEVTRAIAQENEVVEYVKMLERRYDAEVLPHRKESEMPSSDVMVAELEKFLKTQREQSD